MSRVNVERLPVGELAANCYIVSNSETDECFVVDPGAQAETIIAHIGNRKPCAVLLTHGHYDHIGAVDALCEHYGIPVYAHELDAPKLNDANANVSAQFGANVVQHTIANKLADGDVLELAGICVKVIHTPGHSMGSVCYLLPDGQGLLTGDTYFAHGYGRTDFSDGSFALIHRSLRTLFHLTPRMTAYPGHDGLGEIGRDEVEA